MGTCDHGALCALAIAIVLGMFGASFGQGGLTTLSGVWQVLTPLVATFIGSIVAATISERRDAVPSGIMVWCISLVAGALLVAAFVRVVMAPGSGELARSSAVLALGGLAAVLGLVGAVIGSAAGLRMAREQADIAARVGDRDVEAVEQPIGGETATAGRVSRPPRSEPPELRH